MQSNRSTRRSIAGAGVLLALTAGAVPAFAQAAPKLDDPTIIAIFDAANTWDIQTGELAAKKGATKTVKDFGSMLIRDHTNVRQQGRDLAAKLKVTPTPPKDFALAKVHADAMKKLEGLSGQEFDKAFLQNEVEYHQAVIDAINTALLPSLQNAEAKDLVSKVAPAFAAHRDAAKNMLAKGE
jgi:putative membrane protein